MKLFFSRLFFCLFISLPLLSSLAQAQRDRQPPPPPTHANVAYGDHPMQVLDFWKADVGGSGPLVIYIHGGGFRGGSKDRITAATVTGYLEAGVHFASVEYRLIGDKKLPAAHEDAARAIQFIRSKAKEWRINKNWIGAYGGSAGAQLVAYLAWHDDMADADSEDPIARESTRLAAVGLNGGQSTMDLDWWIENIPGYDTPHRQISEYTDLTGEALQDLIEEISIINHISSDDPPSFLSYGMKPDDPIPEDNADGWKIHHVNFGIAMEDKLRRAGVEVTLKYPGPKTRYANVQEFLIEKLAWRGEREKFQGYQSASFTGSNGQTMNYQVLPPREIKPGQKYPLVLFLHGSGGRGPANIRNLIDASVPARLASDAVSGTYEAFYVVPQCPAPNQWADFQYLDSTMRPSVQETLLELIDEFIATHPVDSSRRYITGLSMGGFGTFSAVAARPDFWAAGVAVCGGSRVDDAAKLAKTPFQVYHGDQDPAVDVENSRSIVAAIKEAGGEVHYIEYPGVKHDSWLKAYWDDSLWQWMFKQRR